MRILEKYSVFIALLLEVVVLQPGRAFAIAVKVDLGDGLVDGGEPWSISRLSEEIAGDDAWQGFNRSMFAVEETVMNDLANPLCRVYCSILPRPVILGIGNALDNSEYPVRFVSTLLRGEWAGAWDETKRFLVNTTLGVGGLFDPAKNSLGIFSTDASLSGTFAVWGMPKGNSLILPFVPRSNVRDVAGYILDQGLDPKTYIDYFYPTGIGLGWTTAFWPNYLAQGIDSWNANFVSPLDPYANYRQMIAAKSLLDEKLAFYHYLNELVTYEDGVRRPPVRSPERRPGNLKGRWRDIPDYEPRSPALDSLRQRLFVPVRNEDFWWMRSSIFNNDFAKSVQMREVVVESHHAPARFGFVPASDKASVDCGRHLVFVIPGVGGECQADSTLAMAELIADAGADVVTCDDPFCWQYVRSVNCGILPGNLPEDARRLAAFMRVVRGDLTTAGLVQNPDVSVVGWSMGGLVTAHLAKLEKQGEIGFPIRTLLAINPPVDFEHVVSTVESFLAPTKSWSREQSLAKFVDVMPRLFVWDELKFDVTPDVTEEDAQIVVASSLGSVLPELVASTTQTNAPISLRDYFDRYVQVTDSSRTADSTRRMGLRSLEDVLRAHGRFKMIHTRDDFLLSASDRDYLDDVLGDRMTWFSVGAHCGMFYTSEFKHEVRDRLELSAREK